MNSAERLEQLNAVFVASATGAAVPIEIPKLDEREAAPLTSRECAKVLGSILGGLVVLYGVRETRLACAIGYRSWLRAIVQRENLGVPEPRPVLQAAFIVEAAANGLAEWSGVEAVSDALCWWTHKEEPWASWTALAASKTGGDA
jgi:hypothetical protein